SSSSSSSSGRARPRGGTAHAAGDQKVCPQVGANFAAPSVALEVAAEVCQRPSATANLPLALARARASSARSSAAIALPALPSAAAHTEAQPALAASASEPAATWSSWSPMRTCTSDDDNVLRRAAGFFGDPGSSLEVNLTLPGPAGGQGPVLARPCDIKGATKLAIEIQCPNVHQERQALLTNTKSVTKLKNWTELRGGDSADPEDVLPQERAWIEDDAMDLSMKTLEEDQERRRALAPETIGGRHRSQNEKMLEKLRRP
ncbi:unnamed protein product, partial [Prorocentrum cordatum]